MVEPGQNIVLPSFLLFLEALLNPEDLWVPVKKYKCTVEQHIIRKNPDYTTMKITDFRMLKSEKKMFLTCGPESPPSPLSPEAPGLPYQKAFKFNILHNL